MRLLQLDDHGELSLRAWKTGVPPYAILSHTWGADDDEVTFTDLEGGSGKNKAGFTKIRFCGEQALKDGLQYFWVDTCCIDKSSSAELQEAITSMFRWYQDAAKCYVYLFDVSVTVHATQKHSTDDPLRRALLESRWFCRGWTLQELIAPACVEFFSREGAHLGSKRSLEQDIHNITGIPVEVLRGAPLTDFAVVERLSWADCRETTLPEDKAYCLLGIFNIFMTPFYGEGRENAVLRLQRKIAKSSGHNSKAHATNVPCTEPGKSTTVPTRRQPKSAVAVCEHHQQIGTARWQSGQRKIAKRRSNNIRSHQTFRRPGQARNVLTYREEAHRPGTKNQGSISSQLLAPGAFHALCEYVGDAWGQYTKCYDVGPNPLTLAHTGLVTRSMFTKNMFFALIIITAVYQDPHITRVIRSLLVRSGQGSASMTLLLFAAALAGHLFTQLPTQISLLADNSLSLEDAFGEKIRVPFLWWQHYENFHAYLEDRFKDRPGHDLVIEKSYRLLMGGINGQVLDTTKWPQVVNGQRQLKLTMAMVVNLESHECMKCHRQLERRSLQTLICPSCNQSYWTVEVFLHQETSGYQRFPHEHQHEPVELGDNASAPVSQCATFPPHHKSQPDHSLGVEDEVPPFTHTMLIVEGSTFLHEKIKGTIGDLIQQFHIRLDEKSTTYYGRVNTSIDYPDQVISCLYLLCGLLRRSAVYIDYILNHVGHQYLFDYLTASLRPRSIIHPHQNKPKAVSVPKRTILQVLLVVHWVGRSTLKNCDLILANTNLMHEIMNCARNNDAEVRRECYYTIMDIITPYIKRDEPQNAARARRYIARLRKEGAFDVVSFVVNDPDRHVRHGHEDC